MKALKLKDVMHLYIGCEGVFDNRLYTLTGFDIDTIRENEVGFVPHLYRLQDMTFEHAKEIGLIPDDAVLVMRLTTGMTYKYETHFGIQDGWLNPKYKYKEFTPSQTVIACKLGYNLFGLIESGEAKDKNSLTNKHPHI